MPTRPTLCIGSSSKWRLRILSNVFDHEFDILQCPPEIDEKAIRRSSAEELTVAIAEAKLDAVIKHHRSQGRALPTVILTSDQVAVFNGEIREKPVDPEENYRFLEDYSENAVTTVAGWAVFHSATKSKAFGTHSCTTHFGAISRAVAERVVSRGDSLQCCGGFVIEDVDLASQIKYIENGSVASVQGVHVPLVQRLLLQVNSDSEVFCDRPA